jgi:hypothetical protein
MDGPSIVSSAVLLLVLLGPTFQRILGLDRFITKAMRCVDCSSACISSMAAGQQGGKRAHAAGQQCAQTCLHAVEIQLV